MVSDVAFDSGSPHSSSLCCSQDLCDITPYFLSVWAKSKHPRAGERAVEILDLMKKLHKEENRSDCRPDVFTYTSVIDAVAKQQAALLLTEVEDEYQRTRQEYIKPNVRTYTSVSS